MSSSGLAAPLDDSLRDAAREGWDVIIVVVGDDAIRGGHVEHARPEIEREVFAMLVVEGPAVLGVVCAARCQFAAGWRGSDGIPSRSLCILARASAAILSIFSLTVRRRAISSIMWS